MTDEKSGDADIPENNGTPDYADWQNKKEKEGDVYYKDSKQIDDYSTWEKEKKFDRQINEFVQSRFSKENECIKVRYNPRWIPNLAVKSIPGFKHAIDTLEDILPESAQYTTKSHPIHIEHHRFVDVHKHGLLGKIISAWYSDPGMIRAFIDMDEHGITFEKVKMYMAWEFRNDPRVLAEMIQHYTPYEIIGEKSIGFSMSKSGRKLAEYMVSAILNCKSAESFVEMFDDYDGVFYMYTSEKFIGEYDAWEYSESSSLVFSDERYEKALRIVEGLAPDALSAEENKKYRAKHADAWHKAIVQKKRYDRSIFREEFMQKEGMALEEFSVLEDRKLKDELDLALDEDMLEYENSYYLRIKQYEDHDYLKKVIADR